MSTGAVKVKQPKEKPMKLNTASSHSGKAEVPPSNRNQPTAEQLRIAQITLDRSESDPDIAAKVAQVTELTGCSNDEAVTVLYDCDYDADRAVDKILEGKEAVVDEWQVIDKKKKPPPTSKNSPSDTALDSKSDNLAEQEVEMNHMDGVSRGRRDQGPPRFTRGRGRGGGFNGPDRMDRYRDNTSYDREQGFESNRGRRRGNFGESRGRGGRRGGRSMHSNKFETQIDTWTNESAQNGDKDAQIGSWTDVTDEWTADEWNGSLKESCVFTPSVSSRSVNIYSGSSDMSDRKQALSGAQNMTMTFESSSRQGQANAGPSANADRGVFTSIPPQVIAGQDSVSQQYANKEPSSVAELSDHYGNTSDRTMYVSHYNKEATECIKNVMGIGRPNMNQTAPNIEEMSRTTNQPLVNLQQPVAQIQRVKQGRPRLPPPSKIPSMPVEMPDSMTGGRLDVQFGNWDVMPLAADSNISFMSDVIPGPEYISSSLISSSQSSSSTVSGAVVTTQAMVSSFEPVASKSPMTSSESNAPQAPKQTSFPTALTSGNTTESLHTVVTMSPSSSGLLMSSSKPSGSGFSQLSYSSSSGEEMGSAGPKLPISNGPSHYGSSFGYQSVSAAMVTMSSDYNLSQGQMQYAYGDAQRFGVSGQQTQPPQGFGSTSLPPGYSSGPLPNQLHYSSSQGPVKLFHVADKQATGSYSVSSEIVGLYQSGAEKQGPVFSTALSQSYDSAATYQSTGGYQSASQSINTSMPYPGLNSGLSFQGMPMESGSGNFDASQFPAYRQRDAQAGYDMAGADSQRNVSAAGASFTTSQSQSFSSNFGTQSAVSHAGNGGSQGQVTQLTGGSYGSQSQVLQPTSSNGASQGQSLPSGVSYGNQRQGTPSAGSAFTNHAQGSAQPYGSQGSQSGATLVQSGLTSGLVSSTASSGKLADGLTKLNLKDGQQGESNAAVTSTDGAHSVTTSSLAPTGVSVTSIATSVTTLASKTSIATATKSSVTPTSKPMQNIPPGMPAGATAMLNHNYMIGQPPGFQLAAFGYPATQQLTYSYEELQMLQQRFSNPMPYYDLALQTSAALASRESAAPLGAQSYTGSDVKLAAMDVLSPVNAQPTQQPQGLTGNQQAYINHPLHPAYSYYYPGATGLLPYYPVVPMAIPSVTTAMAGTTSTTQYQKPTVFGGSHAFAMGGQTQDFSKTFGASQVPNKPNAAGVAAGIGANASDLMAGTGSFGKSHVQTYERGGFHGGTPPPSFSMALPSAGGTQTGALGAPAVYGTPYMPIVQHQQSHSQLLHHAMPQDSAVTGRAAPPSAVAQAKLNASKPYSAQYWGSS